MGVMNGHGDGLHKTGGLPEVGNSQSALRNQLGQAFAFHIIHREIMVTVLLRHFVDRDDVGMLQTGRGFGFGAKPLHIGGAGQLAGQDHLHRYSPIQAWLARFIDHPHAAARDLLQQLVIAEVAKLSARGGRIWSNTRPGLRLRNEGQPADTGRAKPFEGAAGKFQAAFAAGAHWCHTLQVILREIGPAITKRAQIFHRVLRSRLDGRQCAITTPAAALGSPSPYRMGRGPG